MASPVLQLAMGVVSAKPATTSPTTIAAGLTSSGASPACILICLSVSSNSTNLTVGTLTDSAGNTYTLLTEAHNATCSSSIWYCNNPNQVLNTTTFTLTHTGGAQCRSYSLRAFELDSNVEDVPNTVGGGVSRSTTGNSSTPSIGSNVPQSATDIFWIGNLNVNAATGQTCTASTSAGELLASGAVASASYPSTNTMEGTSGGSATTNTQAKRAYRRDAAQTGARAFTCTLGSAMNFAASIGGLRILVTGPTTWDASATLAITAVAISASANRDAVASATLASTAVSFGSPTGRIEKVGAANTVTTPVSFNTPSGTIEKVGSANTIANPVSFNTPSGTIEKVASATLATSAVAIAASAVLGQNGSATLAATPVALTASAVKELVASATLAATAVAIAASGNVEHAPIDGAATLAATAVSLTASGTIEKVGSATLAASSVTLSASASRDAVVSATISSPVSLAAVGRLEANAAATLAATAVAIAASGTREKVGTATLAVSPAIAASAVADLFAAATLTINFTTFASANNTVDGSATLAGPTVALTAAANLDANAVAVVTVTSAITADATRDAIVTATLPVSVALTADAVVEGPSYVDAQATLTITPTITSDSIREAVGSATVSTVLTLASSATKDAHAVATLPIAVSFSVEATVQPLVTERSQAEQDAAGRQLRAEWAALVLPPRGASGAPRRGWGPKRGPGATR